MSTATVEETLQAMTVSELKARAKELGIAYADVEPREAGGETPVKADWVRTILETGEGERALPSQQDLIREGLLEGLSNAEIQEKVLEVYPDSAMKPEHVSWTIGNERRNETEWWEAHKDELKELRPRIRR